MNKFTLQSIVRDVAEKGYFMVVLQSGNEAAIQIRTTDVSDYMQDVDATYSVEVIKDAK